MDKWARINYQPNLPLGENRTYLTSSPEHLELSREAAEEGMVLLKNEANVLPLPAGSRAALFGKATFDYVQGGGGSGMVYTTHRRSIYDGFAALGNRVSVFEPLAQFYRENVEQQFRNGALPGLTAEPTLPPELVEQAAAFTDTAIISICRFSGENWDRHTVGVQEDDVEECAILAAKLFEDGDFCLSRAERAMVETVTAHFARVVVVLNVGGMVDTSWFRDNAAIQSVLLAWTAGMEGGRAIANLLTGIATPSGRLSDTFAARLEDYPSTEGFHASRDYVDYTDDIYVGYRYFETIPGQKEKVCYPFGYGLSYTEFSRTVLDFSATEDTVSLTVQVENIGAASGKEVVQLYCSAPGVILDRPARQLIAFAKTRLLQPGETETVVLTFAAAAMAAYDDLGKIQRSAWVLEAGDYRFYLGGDVRSARLLPHAYHCPAHRVTEQLTPKLTPTQLPRRLKADGSYETLATWETNREDNLFLPVMTDEEMEGPTPAVRPLPSHPFLRPIKARAISLREVAEGRAALEDFMAQLPEDDLLSLLCGQPDIGVSNTMGFGNLPEYGVPTASTCDGPAGVRLLPETGIRTTCWPCATLLACTWNEALVYEVGRVGGAEVKENNLAVWLTPAINIHRSPLCGRNFEYYSEDPLVAGKLAAAMVRGIQSQGVAACVKHFAFNNKETNRKHSDSRVSERAARELYLKAFEIVVKEADPWSLMSSYNKINGVHTSQSWDLLTGILRREWGFNGMVTTDWWNFAEQYPEVKAGNDVKMGCGYPDRLRGALRCGALTTDEVRACARRVLELILKLD